MSNSNEPKQPIESDRNEFQRNDIYPSGEDIYNRAKKEADINPENPNRMKVPNEMDEIEQENEKDFGDVVIGVDLDIPGAELDDEEEILGSEDEENNYYSIGGDNHNDLEEEKGQ